MARPEDKKPWVKWYHKDWRGDTRLRRCSLAARGLWMELLSIMWDESDLPGYLVIDGEVPSTAEIARLVGADEGLTHTLLDELEKRQVFSRTSEGVPYSRRQVRDMRRSEAGREHGKKGGNPSLLTATENSDTVKGEEKGEGKPSRKPREITQGVGDKDKASRARDPEARGQRPDKPPTPNDSGGGNTAGGGDDHGLAGDLTTWFLCQRDALFPNTAELPAPTLSIEPVIGTWLQEGLPPATLKTVLADQMGAAAAKGRRPPASPKAYALSLQDALDRHRDAQAPGGGPSAEDLASARAVADAKQAALHRRAVLEERHRDAQAALVRATKGGAPERERQELMEVRDGLAEQLAAIEREGAEA